MIHDKTPIIILSSGNPENLYLTVKSLQRTDLDNNPVIIVDDCSDDPNMQHLLYVNDTVDLNFDKFRNEKTINIVKTPNRDRVLSLNKEFSVIKTPKHLGHSYGILFAINLGFTLYKNSNNVVVLDDDMIFNKNWLLKLKKFRQKVSYIPNIAMVSNYNDIFDNVKNEDDLVENGYMSGKIVMVSKRFYINLLEKGFFSTSDINQNEDIFTSLNRIAFKLGLKSFVSKKSWAQSLSVMNIKLNKIPQSFPINFFQESIIVNKINECFVKPIA